MGSKLFNWKNIQSFVRGCIEPHCVAIRKIHDAYARFNEAEHAAIRAWAQQNFDDINDRLAAHIAQNAAEHAQLRKDMNAADSDLQRQIDALDKRLSEVHEEMKDEMEQTKDEVHTTLDSFTTIPIGTVIIWPFSGKPADADKWLLCDGSPISSSSYPDLYRLCGGRTPDYRGYFLRGLGGNSAGLGVVQQDANKKHSHNLYIQTYLGGGPRGFIQDENGSYGVWFTTSESGEDEARPINKAVNFHIRALQ